MGATITCEVMLTAPALWKTVIVGVGERDVDNSKACGAAKEELRPAGEARVADEVEVFR